MNDLISRQAAIDAISKTWIGGTSLCWADTATDIIKKLPSAQPEPHPISYTDCANAMMKMQIENVLTDGEYNRVMDKLNDRYPFE